ncbi:MAG TPA: hypothetical protein VEL74_23825 [Thermoanaerobaculia bacterium]|nr:hypothetical protein [Thermoanaerobaculia bacterium]
MRALYPLLLMLLVGAPLVAQAPAPSTATEPRLTVTFSPPSQLTVGDRVEATLDLTVRTADLTGEPRFPSWQEGWGEAEIVEKGAPEKVREEGGVATYRQRLVLAAFRPGKVALPPMAVALPGARGTAQALTPPDLALEIGSVLPAEEKNPEARPPAALRALPLGERFWWTLAAASALCLGLLFLLWRQARRSAAAAPAAPPLPPFDELLRELDNLQREPSPLAVHTRLSLALRHYLGRALSFPAAESTTSEIQRQLVYRRVPGTPARRLVELLRACDLVKFARQDAGTEPTRERIGTAREIAREVEMYVQPPALQEKPPEQSPAKLEAAG